MFSYTYNRKIKGRDKNVRLGLEYQRGHTLNLPVCIIINGLFNVINDNKCVLFLKCITFLLIRGVADILERNSSIHKCETSGSITKGLAVREKQYGGEETSALSFWRFLFPRVDRERVGKRVICSNERHKNILCDAWTKKREVDVMGNRI